MLTRGRYRARLADGAEDLRLCQELRHLCFVDRAARPPQPGHRDRDALDPLYRQVMVEEVQSGTLLCTFRLLPLRSGAEISRSYSARYYDLSALRAYPGRMVEMGRFCIRPGARDPDLLRVAWGAMTGQVDSEGVEMLFGCSSFIGTAIETYLDAFALLGERHLAPRRWGPRIKAPEVFRFAERLAQRPADPRVAMRRMPPLLKTYLAMGGWVSDHAVVDREMNTLHVFTGLEIGKVPPARARALRAVAG